MKKRKTKEEERNRGHQRKGGGGGGEEEGDKSHTTSSGDTHRGGGENLKERWCFPKKWVQSFSLLFLRERSELTIFFLIEVKECLNYKLKKKKKIERECQVK